MAFVRQHYEYAVTGKPSQTCTHLSAGKGNRKGGAPRKASPPPKGKGRSR